LRTEVATKTDIERVRVEIAEVRGDVKRLDLQTKLLIGLAVVAIGMFSPVSAKLFTFVK